MIETEPATPDAAPPEAAPLRVGWIAGRRTVARLSRTLKPLAVGLLDELVDLTVFCPEAADVDVLPSPPVQVVRHGRLRWLRSRRRAMDAVAAEIRRRKIQLLHALDGECAKVADRLARRAGVPWVLTVLSPRQARRLGRLRGHAAAVLAASKPIRAELLGRRRGDPQRIHLVRPGVYHVARSTCFGDSRYCVAILAAGPLRDVQAFDAVLKACAELRRRGYEAAYFIVGRGRGERQLRARADQLGLRSSLTFVEVAQGDQLPGVYRAADVYISPSPQETVNLHALLALAAGAAVLAVRDGVSDFLIDGKTAQIFARGDAAELTVKLTALLDDREAARSLADSALAYLAENHSAARMVSTVAEIYRSVV